MRFIEDVGRQQGQAAGGSDFEGHTSEADASNEVLIMYSKTAEDRKKADGFIAIGDVNSLSDFVESRIKKYRILYSYTIQK